MAERVASSRFGRALGTFLAKRAHASTPDLQWKVTHGPAFGNSLAELTLRGRGLELAVSAAKPGPTLEESWAARIE
jgi:hypothetical protein